MGGGAGLDPHVAIILVVFPFVFVGFWLAITTALATLSGWTDLQDIYPDRSEGALLSLHMQSGQLGKGSPLNPFGTVSYSGCLRFDVCPGGLRVTILKILGYFQRPIFVPWGEITVARRTMVFSRGYALRFGQRSSLALSIGRRAYARIA